MAALLSQGFSQSRQAFPESMNVAASPYTTAGASNLAAAGANLTGVGEPVDVNSIYDAVLSEAQRGLQRTGIPQIKEQFGARGGRYGSDIATAIANAIGDMTSKVETGRAQAQVGERQAAKGRQISGAQALTGIGGAQANIGQSQEGLDTQNLMRRFQEFLRMNQAPGAELFGTAQNFINTKPIFPETVGGPAPAIEKGISWLDVANTIANLGKSGAAVAGAF